MPSVSTKRYKLDDILLLGDPRLYEVCTPIKREEVAGLQQVIDGMADLILQFRARYGAGRAIAAPQIGVMKRLIVLNIDRPIAMINPMLTNFSEEKMILWDDCMSFPNLLVQLERHQSCTLHFRTPDWQEETWQLDGDLSELLQHEYDHLDGILATSRALDERSLKWKV